MRFSLILTVAILVPLLRVATAALTFDQQCAKLHELYNEHLDHVGKAINATAHALKSFPTLYGTNWWQSLPKWVHPLFNFPKADVSSDDGLPRAIAGVTTDEIPATFYKVLSTVKSDFTPLWELFNNDKAEPKITGSDRTCKLWSKLDGPSAQMQYLQMLDDLYKIFESTIRSIEQPKTIIKVSYVNQNPMEPDTRSVPREHQSTFLGAVVNWLVSLGTAVTKYRNPSSDKYQFCYYGYNLDEREEKIAQRIAEVHKQIIQIHLIISQLTRFTMHIPSDAHTDYEDHFDRFTSSLDSGFEDPISEFSRKKYLVVVRRAIAELASSLEIGFTLYKSANLKKIASALESKINDKDIAYPIRGITALDKPISGKTMSSIQFRDLIDGVNSLPSKLPSLGITNKEPTVDTDIRHMHGIHAQEQFLLLLEEIRKSLLPLVPSIKPVSISCSRRDDTCITPTVKPKDQCIYLQNVVCWLRSVETAIKATTHSWIWGKSRFTDKDNSEFISVDRVLYLLEKATMHGGGSYQKARSEFGFSGSPQ